MTDERLCARCGHMEGMHAQDQESDLDGRPVGEPYDFCFACVQDDLEGNRHPFEAAPSTDEGEARPVVRETITDAEFRAEQRVLRWYGNMVTGDFFSDVQAYRAAIRAPLEERIRELEARIVRGESVAAQGDEFADRVLAENERLREALRDTATHLNMASLVVDTALLPSPPSSTEGTKEVEG